ncbi:hypothetical protein ADIS_1576 [Lunatimonas lonarensis]|uniref:Uncharacterized protein n=1 Tax=Lunatimonas lonarensis TaxID=1232681 RepID=R7ZVC5_9BACT|nr:hypothetical protein ADIS_1576 [Lunatimonas lonarensis]
MSGRTFERGVRGGSISYFAFIYNLDYSGDDLWKRSKTTAK